MGNVAERCVTPATLIPENSGGSLAASERLRPTQFAQVPRPYRYCESYFFRPLSCAIPIAMKEPRIAKFNIGITASCMVFPSLIDGWFHTTANVVGDLRRRFRYQTRVVLNVTTITWWCFLVVIATARGSDDGLKIDQHEQGALQQSSRPSLPTSAILGATGIF
ncbi:MAG: hypothetical protein AAF680_10660 [Pseudomonadota bacterium]